MNRFKRCYSVIYDQQSEDTHTIEQHAGFVRTSRALQEIIDKFEASFGCKVRMLVPIPDPNWYFHAHRAV